MNNQPKFSCMLLCGDHEYLSSAAETFARRLFDVKHVSRYARSARELEPAVVKLATRAGGGIDFLLSFLSPVIVPPPVLRGIRRAAVNFHPAPPRYPGIGSASFALFDGDETFGVTAHLMADKVDSGPILRTMRFPISADDDCQSLATRARDFSLLLFYQVLPELARGGEIFRSGESWERAPITRREFEQWMRVNPSDPPERVHRKVRALAHATLPGAYVEVAGTRFHALAAPSTPVAHPALHRRQEAA